MPAAKVVTAADLSFCVTETNRYRAMLGRAPLAQSPDIEGFALAAAQMDSPSNTPHSYYAAHWQGFGAENEALNWPVAGFDSVRTVVQQAILAFWSEGPGGGHYENMNGPFTQLGCGIYIAGQSITLVQDYR